MKKDKPASQMRKNWKWNHRGILSFLSIFAFVCINFSVLIAGLSISLNAVRTIQAVIVLSFIIFIVAKADGHYSLINKAISVILAIIIYCYSKQLLSPIIDFIIISIIRKPLPENNMWFVTVNSTIETIIGALPVLFWTMWRFRVFVKDIKPI